MRHWVEADLLSGQWDALPKWERDQEEDCRLGSGIGTAAFLR